MHLRQPETVWSVAFACDRLHGHRARRPDPFFVGAGAVFAAMCVLWTVRSAIHALDATPEHGAEVMGSENEAQALTIGDS